MTEREEGMPIELLNQLLRLDREAGQLFWKARKPSLFRSGKRPAEHVCANWNSRYAGTPALSSGSLGVNFHKARNKWQASITVNYRAIHLGFFLTREEAIKARKDAQKRYGFHSNHGGVAS